MREAIPTNNDIKATARNIYNSGQPIRTVDTYDEIPEHAKADVYERACEVYRRIELL